jgi:hypothetical protein
MENMNTKYKLVFLTLGALIMFSCDNYLNVQPDNRVMIDTPDKVQQLLINSYPNKNYSVITELSSDNFIDNNAPNSKGLFYTLNPFDRIDDDIFSWTDPRITTDNDTPYDLWETYYQSIAGANAALQAIDGIIQKGVSDETLNKTLLPCKGEALILRAYSHFMLVNIFSKAYKDAESSKNDIGILYVTEPVNVVKMESKRNSVAEVYELIAKDIEEGIGLINDGAYKVPKYHFNKNAAHAFAAQFYLFKRDYAKVIEHANAVLGANPAKLLRDWSIICNSSQQYSIAYMNADEPANLLLMPTFSTFFRRFLNCRYAYNGNARNGSIDDRGPTWSGRAPFATGWMWTTKADYGSFMAKIAEQFEYTDRVAGIGFPHIIRTEFTTDATLLDRAEAYLFLNDIDAAVADLQAWNLSHKSTTVLTKTLITNFYTSNNPDFSRTFHTTELSPEFTVSSTIKPYVDCVLHFRRLERVFEGHRWFDIKRYGIELDHYVGNSNTRLTLTYDDDRRAIQIPSDVVGAGVKPNPRSAITGDSYLMPAE